VRIVLSSSPKHSVLVSTVAQPDGSFTTTVVMPRAAKPGEHRLQVVGTSSSGQPASWAVPVMVLADLSRPAGDSSSLATPVLISMSIGFPLVTWLVLDMLAWRQRRFGERPRGT
jgi:hypothetical protein